MKITLLTTNTPHHLYYAWQLGERFALQAIVLEDRVFDSGFETRHPIDEQQDAYERQELLAAFGGKFSDVGPTYSFENVNDPESLQLLMDLKPEVILVFGTGKLNPRVIRSAEIACLNLHGGQPELYRGLDTHLWAIYHGDFACLVTTLHHVDEGLDTGDIVLQTALPLSRTTELPHLRAINTRECLRLTTLALEGLHRLGWMPSRPQLARGRYYSAMPTALKDTCAARFSRHVESLPG